jgi:ribosomal protein S18 acetylase RimI-like enzyme
VCERSSMSFGSVEPSAAGALAALMFVEPLQEIIGLSGDARGAERLSAALFRHALEADPRSIITVSHDDQLAGFAQMSAVGDVESFTVLAKAALRAFGLIGAVRAAWRNTARAKVDLSPPPNALHLVELQVHPAFRNQGLGAALLDEVLARAAHREKAVSLTTGIDNPARHLYERRGFQVVAERRNERYQRLTGSPGRVLMVS